MDSKELYDKDKTTKMISKKMISNIVLHDENKDKCLFHIPGKWRCRYRIMANAEKETNCNVIAQRDDEDRENEMENIKAIRVYETIWIYILYMKLGTYKYMERYK